MNITILRGHLSSDPRPRDLPSGDEIINYEVSTLDPDGRRQGVPVVWYVQGRTPRLQKGDEVVVVGEVRRRFFRAGGFTQSRTEVVASLVVAPNSKRLAGALQSALSPVSDGLL